MAELRVVIVDDDCDIRRAVRSCLELEPDIAVVGEATDGAQGARLAEELLPDVALVDIRMPGLDGIAATRRLALSAPSVRVLMLTWSEDVEDLTAAVLAGAKGYLVHATFGPAELLQAVRTIHAGGALITPMLAPALLDLVRAAAQDRPAPAPRTTTLAELTAREVEVLELVQAGLSNRDIAGRLCIEEKTVKNHISNIYSKLQFRSRYEAIVAAYDPRG